MWCWEVWWLVWFWIWSPYWCWQSQWCMLFFIFRFKHFATMFYFLYNFYILFCMMVITFLLCLFWICLYFAVYSIHILLMMIVSNVLLINNFLRRYNMHSSSIWIFNFLFKLSYCFNLFFFHQFLQYTEIKLLTRKLALSLSKEVIFLLFFLLIFI